jgi:hypothetical protein
MSADTNFMAEARDTYVAANAATLRWMLDRPALGRGFLNTKMNSITHADYGPADGQRGPAYTYGWIQGRGLEALATHAAYFATRDPAFAAALDERGRMLYAVLAEMQRSDGHAYFCYDADMSPICFDEAGRTSPQTTAGDVYTYSDAFVAKGLVAAAARYAPNDLRRQLDYLDGVIRAIEEDRFQMNESAPLSTEAAAAQPKDFGPRMILLGAAGLLARIGQRERAGFADRFIGHVLERHLDPSSGLLANVPGEDACNVGHAIEFVGFVLEFFGASAPTELVRTLQDLLSISFRAGFVKPGITLAVSMRTGAALRPYCPWWSLPETIRAAALCFGATGDSGALSIWREAHGAFFTHYWRGAPPIAYQTLTRTGPVDFVPATPDLDPGYHTGLSLLAAIEFTERR